MEARQAEVLAAQQELHAEYRVGALTASAHAWSTVVKSKRAHMQLHLPALPCTVTQLWPPGPHEMGQSLMCEVSWYLRVQSMKRQLAPVSDEHWDVRGAALPSAHSPNTVKRVSW
jgi:hypothetical protein